MDAAYDLDADDQTWTLQVLQSGRAVWGQDGPGQAAIYDASKVAAISFESFQALDFSDEGRLWLQRAIPMFTPAYVAGSFRSLLVGNCSHCLSAPELAPFLGAMAAMGLPDHYAINGLDPLGRGALVVFWTRQRFQPSAREGAIYRRLAHHLGAAHRVRRRLRAAHGPRPAAGATVGAEAIIDRRRRRIVHAEGAARAKSAQVELIETFDARDRARRTGAGTVDGLRRWAPLTDARWTLVDSYERDGARYVVARENQSPVPGLSALSDRERQVVVYLAIGMSTKEIAYALGISDVTVRVLVARAASKLRVRSRAQLLEHPEIRRLRPLG
jgi:DNA-binding CsgD family transcriptional regulator